MYILQEYKKSAVADIYGSKVDPEKGRMVIVDALKVLDQERTWGPKNKLAVPNHFDHVMYWVAGWVSITTRYFLNSNL